MWFPSCVLSLLSLFVSFCVCLSTVLSVCFSIFFYLHIFFCLSLFYGLFVLVLEFSFKYYFLSCNHYACFTLHCKGFRQGGGGLRSRQNFLDKTAPSSSDENWQFPNFNPWNKVANTKFRKKKWLPDNKNSCVSA